MKKLFYPFYRITKSYKYTIIFTELLILLGILQFLNLPYFPQPTKIFTEILNLTTSNVFYDNLITTMLFLVKAFLYSIGATLILSYLWTINLFKPLVELIIKLRYLPFACVSFMFTNISDNIEQVKNYILLFGLIPYFTASFVSEIAHVVDDGKEINKSLINKNNFFETLLEVVIIGKIDKIFDVIKLNFAIAWTMIVSVECLAYNSGGLGTMIISGQKHLQLEKVYAIAIIILLIGIGIDKLISYIKKLTISYAI